MFADSSSERATCSTVWLGDHFPGARGEVQVVLVRSPAMINCSIASLLASRAVLISAIGPPFPEHAPADPTPRQARPQRHESTTHPQTDFHQRWVRRPMAPVHRAVAGRRAAVRDGDTSD